MFKPHIILENHKLTLRFYIYKSGLSANYLYI